MGETEFLDLTSRNHCRQDNSDLSSLDMENEEFFIPGKSRVQDFKKGNASYNQSSGASFINPEKEEKKMINVSDEKIVWVGAIFVFFGVLVFLIGFWLGKATMRDVRETSAVTKTLEERAADRDASAQYAVNPVLMPESNTARPEVVVPLPAVSAVQEQPVQVQPVQKAEPKTVKLEAVKKAPVAVKSDPVVKTVKPAVVKPNVPDYTIQVSAHTSMEKARSIEDTLRGMGMHSYIVEATVNGVTYYRVRVGKFAGKADAETSLQKIRSMSLGKDSFIVNLN